MKRSSIETSVGIFVLIGILCVGYLTIKLGKLEWFEKDNYTIFARFQSISGLKKGASVEIAGIKIGSVDSITYDQDRMAALVGMKIEKDIPLTDDVIASIKTSGLIGDKYIKLSPGGSEEFLKPGGMIVTTEPAVDIEELISKYVFGNVE
jgi:phospholipid/cholesterol/gamma-HCH transport system substrate-binding protein